MKMDYNRKIVLEDGSEYEGYGFGDMCDKVCEIVFNTSMVGYQEIISDPSYTYQAVVMTYPLIGNYGICDDDFETKTPSIGALIVREYNDEPSNFRCTQSLAETMKKYEIPGIYGVDTRQIARSIRDLGSRKVLITGIETSRDDALRILERTDIPKDAVKTVSPKEILFYPVPNPKHHIVCVDCGMKKNILRSFNKKGISVSVVPHDTSDSVIESLNPDGVFISNGPGDPEDVPKTIETIKKLIGTDISELLNFVCDEQEEIHDNNIMLKRNIKPRIFATTDSMLLARIFINLINNSYNYGKDNGNIEVTLIENDEEVLFKVTDDGIGISEENLNKIWDRFYQVDPSRTNNDGSMGLGLSMVKLISDKLGGTITVKSKLGEGTIFTFTMKKNIQ